MKIPQSCWLLGCLALAGCQSALAPKPSAPIALHPENPHYFLWRDKPAILLTSAEHYGAVLNLDFDFKRYLDTLAADGLNYTRIFTGAYVEPGGAFNIARNTLAPAPNRFASPWARSAEPGYQGGGNKFDLARFDESYFTRLREFLSYADRRGIVVEVTLFCPMYEESQWSASPMNLRNNINGVGDVGHTDVHTLDRHGGLLPFQEALVRKVVTEVNGFGNVFFEICNEPYWGGVTLPWQRRIAEVIVDTERALPVKHLLAQNIANHTATITDPHPAVSIFNFHYAKTSALELNYHLPQAFGDDETGFSGNEDAAYRTEAWNFILSGGALYNNLDYSFTVGAEDGTYRYPSATPGGGGRALRKQVRILRDFMEGFDFLRLQPSNKLASNLPDGSSVRVLADSSREVALYLHNQGTLPAWSARWTGFIEAPASGDYVFHITSQGGVRLWIDEVPIIDNGNDHAIREDQGHATLAAGRKHAIRLEYYYRGGDGVLKLEWTPPDGKKATVPASVLRLPDSGWGLHGEYFTDAALTKPWRTRDDGSISFKWGKMPPLATRETSPPTTFDLALGPGDWNAEWIDTKTGTIVSRVSLSGGGPRAVTSPPYDTDIALRVRRR